MAEELGALAFRPAYAVTFPLEQFLAELGLAESRHKPVGRRPPARNRHDGGVRAVARFRMLAAAFVPALRAERDRVAS